MGWTYDEYLDAPDYFISAIAIKINTEALVHQRQERELSRKSMRGR